MTVITQSLLTFLRFVTSERSFIVCFFFPLLGEVKFRGYTCAMPSTSNPNSFNSLLISFLLTNILGILSRRLSFKHFIIFIFSSKYSIEFNTQGRLAATASKWTSSLIVFLYILIRIDSNLLSIL